MESTASSRGSTASEVDGVVAPCPTSGPTAPSTSVGFRELEERRVRDGFELEIAFLAKLQTAGGHVHVQRFWGFYGGDDTPIHAVSARCNTSPSLLVQTGDTAAASSLALAMPLPTHR